jgi:hypothetical protein
MWRQIGTFKQKKSKILRVICAIFFMKLVSIPLTNMAEIFKMATKTRKAFSLTPNGQTDSLLYCFWYTSAHTFPLSLDVKNSKWRLNLLFSPIFCQCSFIFATDKRSNVVQILQGYYILFT